MDGSSDCVVDRPVAAVQPDIGDSLDSSDAQMFLSKEWLRENLSPFEHDNPPAEWNNPAYRSLCRRHVIE